MYLKFFRKIWPIWPVTESFFLISYVIRVDHKTVEQKMVEVISKEWEKSGQTACEPENKVEAKFPEKIYDSDDSKCDSTEAKEDSKVADEKAGEVGPVTGVQEGKFVFLGKDMDQAVQDIAMGCGKTEGVHTPEE